MATLFLTSPEPLAGKTTLAVGLAQRFRASGRAVALKREGDDEHAAADAQIFAAIAEVSEPADVTIIEAASGGATIPSDARAMVVANASSAAGDLARYCQALGGSPAGVVVNRVPQKRVESVRATLESAGIKFIALIPEDRTLAAPNLGDVAAALQAEVRFLNGAQFQPVEHPLIASISADPGQGYFTRHGASTVIVRSDKPDLQLAALNAGATALIVTGGLPILSYVLDRAEADEIPLLRTKLDTLEAVRGIEALFGALPFSGGEAKLARISELLAAVDVEALLSQ